MNLNTIVQNYVEGSQAGVGSSSETTAVQKLRDNGVSCIELVTMCGQYLTSENIQERTRGLRFEGINPLFSSSGIACQVH